MLINEELCSPNPAADFSPDQRSPAPELKTPPIACPATNMPKLIPAVAAKSLKLNSGTSPPPALLLAANASLGITKEAINENTSTAEIILNVAPFGLPKHISLPSFSGNYP